MKGDKSGSGCAGNAFPDPSPHLMEAGNALFDRTPPDPRSRPGFKLIRYGWGSWRWVKLPDNPLYSLTESGNYKRVNKPSRPSQIAMKLLVFDRDNWTCHICGKVYERPEGFTGEQYARGLTLDHYPIPYRDGGEFTPENLRAACEKCNASRGARRK